MRDIEATLRKAEKDTRRTLALGFTCLVGGKTESVCEVKAGLHTKQIQTDIVEGSGSSDAWAVALDIDPRLVFYIPDGYRPNAKDIYLKFRQTGDLEGYRCVTTQQIQGQSITALCVRLEEEELKEKKLTEIMGC